MMLEKLDTKIESLIPKLKAFIVTLADKGACLYTTEYPNGLLINGFEAEKIVDPTGCGDAFRAGFIYALENNMLLQEAIKLGNKMGSHKISYAGGQGYPKLNLNLELVS
jgi:adenosine kinase